MQGLPYTALIFIWPSDPIPSFSIWSSLGSDPAGFHTGLWVNQKQTAALSKCYMDTSLCGLASPFATVVLFPLGSKEMTVAARRIRTLDTWWQYQRCTALQRGEQKLSDVPPLASNGENKKFKRRLLHVCFLRQGSSEVVAETFHPQMRVLFQLYRPQTDGPGGKDKIASSSLIQGEFYLPTNEKPQLFFHRDLHHYGLLIWNRL